MYEGLFRLVKFWLMDSDFISFPMLKRRLLSHPDLPSVSALTDTFDELGISNAVVKLAAKYLPDLPIPFMAIIQENRQEKYLLVSQITKSEVHIIGEYGDKSILSFSYFLELWTGVVILLEAPKKIGKLHRWHKFVVENRIPIVLGILIFAFLFIFIFIKPFYHVAFTALSILGLLLSWWIVQKERGEINPFVQKLCGHSDKINCDVVLHADQARLWGISLADISISYFATLTLSAFILSSIFPLLVFALCALPITFYLWYIQGRILRAWCVLCLSISATLWAQGVITMWVFYWIDPSLFSMHLLSILQFIGIGIVITLVWYKIKRLSEKIRHFESIEEVYLRFRRNYHLFIPYWQAKITTIPSHLFSHEIIFGNRNAALQITFLVNPMCAPCIEAHAKIKRLLEKHENNVALQLRFFVEANENDERKIFVEHFLRLSFEQSPNFCHDALIAWYKSQDYNSWAAQFPLQEQSREVQSLLEAHESWYKLQGIGIAPQLWINGKHFPDWYDPEDLSGFIPHILQGL